MKRVLLTLLIGLLLVGCGQVGVPDGCKVVSGFDVERYLGDWYEIARLDSSFERGLTHVSARYEKRKDGKISVTNKGFRPSAGRWEEAKGVAVFMGAPTEASLKVSFFGPFWGGYNVLALDPDYQWAMVCGPNRSYLWILARQRTLDPKVMESLLEQAKALRFPVDKLVRVVQDEPLPVARPVPQTTPEPMPDFDRT